VQSLRTIARNSKSPAPEGAPKTLAEAIYLRMRQDILSGKLKPGSKLRFADLAVNYEAGTSTLRESLSRLTADRLVIAEGQRGFRVAPISLTDMRDITKLRTEIESAALQESIDAGDDTWEADILAYLHRLVKLEERSDGTPILLNEEGAQVHKLFHMSLLRASQSIWRLRVVDVLYDHSERYRRLQTSYLPGERNTAQEHREIAEAVISRNKRRATALLTLHLEKTAEALATVKAIWPLEKHQ
jgi:GntR family transcriptional regulator, carbon starvation induced regulator